MGPVDLAKLCEEDDSVTRKGTLLESTLGYLRTM